MKRIAVLAVLLALVHVMPAASRSAGTVAFSRAPISPTEPVSARPGQFPTLPPNGNAPEQPPRALSVFYSANFEDTVFPPAGWTLQTYGPSEDSWRRVTQFTYPAGVAPYRGSGMAEYNIWDYPARAGCRFISLAFNPNGAVAHVDFAMLKGYSPNFTADSLAVEYSTDGGATWTPVGVSSPLLLTPGTPNWWYRDFALPALTGSVRIALNARSDFGYVNIGIDNVRIYLPYPQDVGTVTILKPVGYVVTNSSQTVRVLVRNYGSDSATFPVRARMIHAHEPFDTVWSVNRTVTNLHSGDTTTVGFGSWAVPAVRDSWRLAIRTALTGDSDGTNNLNMVSVSSYPPRFGTVLGLHFMRDSDYSNAGITWRPDSGRFYFVAMRPRPGRVFSFSPAAPVTSKRDEAWTFLNLGDTVQDRAWGIAWNSDEQDFWITQMPDDDISSAYAVRQTALGQPGGTPADTWRLLAVEDSFWFGGICCLPGSYCLATKVGGTNRFYKLDLARKQVLGFAPGPALAYRACCAFEFGDTAWILSGGWNQGTLYKLDTLGNVLDSAALPNLADCAVYIPALPDPDSLVCGFATINAPANPLVEFSLGLTWGDFGVTGVRSRDRSGAPVAFSLAEARPNPFLGKAMVQYGLPSAGPVSLNVYSITGRLVRALQKGPQLPGYHRVSWDGRDNQGRDVSPGVYLCRYAAAGHELVRKLVLVR